MVDFDNLDELKALRARGAVDDRQYELLRRRLARRIISDRREAAFSKSGAVYIVLAFFTGAIGLHNFYAGYYKRGWTQAILTIVSPLFAFLPLLATAAWLSGSCFGLTAANGTFFAAQEKLSGCCEFWRWQFLSLFTVVPNW
ncbi:MAG: TM2 domain-containing protein [Alphaproteobacteria bacterium]